MIQLASRVYSGTVHHRRNAPKVHQFRYSLYMLYLDLDELDEVFSGRWFWGQHALSIFRFCRKDHLGPPEEPLKLSVLKLVEKESGKRLNGPVRLLTNLRCWGYSMNPVCFYYCFDESGQTVEAVVAEVSNTPWGERHCYVISTPGLKVTPHREVQPKVFHVSPFMEMDMQYHWTLSFPGDVLQISIVNHQHHKPLFSASLALKPSPINNWTLFKTGLKHPWMSAKIISAIYWNALKLWWKGVAYVPHPDATQPESLNR